MCLNPKWIYKKGYYKESNYRGLKDEFYEIGTYSKCGACEQCIAEKSNNWVIRNKYESDSQEKKCFITLTYENNPIILIKKDFQDFIKRFRRNLEYKNYDGKIRYFVAGEYGDRNGRPHFHIIIYGWQDENAKYLGINFRKNICYQSEIIQKCWGLGRTSYQEFNEHEIPYISLYSTPKETFKKAYKMNYEKLKTLKNYALNHANMKKAQKENLIKEIIELQKILEKSKEKYILIKEFNSWSIALGWEEFFKNYANSKEYAFEEYIEDKCFATPTPWIKKLANKMGDIKAAEEMFRREELIIQSANEAEEIRKNKNKIDKERKKEILKNVKDTKNGENSIF